MSDFFRISQTIDLILVGSCINGCTDNSVFKVSYCNDSLSWVSLSDYSKTYLTGLVFYNIIK